MFCSVSYLFKVRKITLEGLCSSIILLTLRRYLPAAVAKNKIYRGECQVNDLVIYWFHCPEQFSLSRTIYYKLIDLTHFFTDLFLLNFQNFSQFYCIYLHALFVCILQGLIQKDYLGAVNFGLY